MSTEYTNKLHESIDNLNDPREFLSMALGDPNDPLGKLRSISPLREKGLNLTIAYYFTPLTIRFLASSVNLSKRSVGLYIKKCMEKIWEISSFKTQGLFPLETVLSFKKPRELIPTTIRKKTKKDSEKEGIHARKRKWVKDALRVLNDASSDPIAIQVILDSLNTRNYEHFVRKEDSPLVPLSSLGFKKQYAERIIGFLREGGIPAARIPYMKGKRTINLILMKDLDRARKLYEERMNMIMDTIRYSHDKLKVRMAMDTLFDKELIRIARSVNSPFVNLSRIVSKRLCLTAYHILNEAGFPIRGILHKTKRTKNAFYLPLKFVEEARVLLSSHKDINKKRQ